MVINIAILIVLLAIMISLALYMDRSKRIIHCPDCKFYYAPVCTFHKWLPMVSRRGYCYHARKGKYQGPTPKLKYTEKDCIKITGISYDGVQCILCTDVKTGENGFYNPQTNIFTALESR